MPGSIDVFRSTRATCSSNFDKDASARTDAEVYQALGGAPPKGLRVGWTKPPQPTKTHVVPLLFRALSV